MRLQVSDIGSNHPENVQRWAIVLGTGDVRRKIFLTIYSSRKKLWSIPEIAERTGLDPKLIATQGRKMCVGGLFEQLDGSRVVYQKIDDVHHAKDLILRAADSKKLREAILTKRNAFKGGTTFVTKTTNTFRNVGVANTGKMSGSITGNSQHNQVHETATELLRAVAHFKQSVANTPSLSMEQREDATNAAIDLEGEVKKPVESRSLSKVRNAVGALKMLASGTQALHTLYDQIHPLITSHFHLPS